MGGTHPDFDPFDEQPLRWVAFQRDMARTSLAADEEQAIIEMAKATSCAISGVSDEMSWS